jgi:ATP-binding cassette subfamily B protein
MTEKIKYNEHINRLVLIKEFSTRLFIGLFIMTLTVVMQLAFPKAISYFIDSVQIEQSTSWYRGFVIVMLGAIIIHAIATTLRYYIFESTGLMIVAKVRRILHQAFLDQNIAFYDKHNVGELNNRLSADVEVLQDTLTMGLAISLRCLCVLIGGVIMLITLSPLLSLMVLLFIPISMSLGKWAGKSIRIRSRDMQQSQAMCAKVAHDNFSNIKIVHAFNGQPKAQVLYQNVIEDNYHISLERARFLAKFRGISTFILYFALLVTLWLGANMISKGTMSIGELTSFIIYAGMVTSSADGLSDFWSEWMLTIGSTERIFEIIKQTPEVKKTLSNNHDFSGPIDFENIDFSYPERPQHKALNNFNLSVEQGEKIALVGSSGAGKSTVASLLLGYYQVNNGTIKFNGVAMENININDLRSNIAIVEQEPSLFHGSIFYNIAYASPEKKPTVFDVEQAAKLANAHDFIKSFPQGYNTLVGDRGVQLSGGQKQRIAIARALLRNPEILILDEATSALDSSSEYKVQKALDNLMEGRTTIMIAHRFSTIAKADRVLVLDQGNIVEQGTHKELSESENGLYNQLVSYQAIDI